MARGSECKTKITQKILETFPGAFQYNKEIRVPMEENGELIQIKVTLTAAKDNVEVGEDTAIPGGKVVDAPVLKTVEKRTEMATEPTLEEKENLAKLIASVF